MSSDDIDEWDPLEVLPRQGEGRIQNILYLNDEEEEEEEGGELDQEHDGRKVMVSTCHWAQTHNTIL